MEFLITLQLKSLTHWYHSGTLTYIGNVPFNDSDIDYSLHHCWLPWQTRKTVLVMAQYMWHAHSEANKQDWKPMQHMIHITVYFLVCYIFNTSATLIFTKHTESEMSIFHKINLLHNSSCSPLLWYLSLRWYDVNLFRVKKCRATRLYYSGSLCNINTQFQRNTS